MFMKKNQMVDERIQKESNQFTSKQLYILVPLTIALLLVKLVLRLPFYLYLLECISLLATVLYVVIREASKGILFMKEKDETIQTIHEDILAKAFNFDLGILVFGELVFMFASLLFAGEYFFWCLSYIAIWFPSTLWITIRAIKGGLLIWGSQKRETVGKKQFAVRTAVGAVFFGAMMTVYKVIVSGSFHVSDILYGVFAALGWGVLFYLLFMLMMKIAEKQADKLVGEETDEE